MILLKFVLLGVFAALFFAAARVLASYCQNKNLKKSKEKCPSCGRNMRSLRDNESLSGESLVCISIICRDRYGREEICLLVFIAIGAALYADFNHFLFG